LIPKEIYSKEEIMHSEICPVCSGTGKYNGAQCHGCDGDGWVEVSNGDCNPPWDVTFTPCPQDCGHPYYIATDPAYPNQY